MPGAAAAKPTASSSAAPAPAALTGAALARRRAERENSADAEDPGPAEGTGAPPKAAPRPGATAGRRPEAVAGAPAAAKPPPARRPSLKPAKADEPAATPKRRAVSSASAARLASDGTGSTAPRTPVTLADRRKGATPAPAATPTPAPAEPDTAEAARKGNFTSVKDVIKHIEAIGQQRLGKLNDSASAVQTAGKKGVFRIKMAARTLAEAYVTALGEMRTALATELGGAFARCERAIARVPEGPLGATTFLAEARAALEAAKEEAAREALVRRGRRAAKRRAAAKLSGGGDDAAGEEDAEEEAEDAAASLESIEDATSLAERVRDRRAAEIDAACRALVGGYTSRRLRAVVSATALAPAVAAALSSIRTAQATELGPLLEKVRSAVLRVRAELTGARRAFLQTAGAMVLGEGEAFDAAMAREVEEWSEWRSKREEANAQAAEAARAKAEAEGKAPEPEAAAPAAPAAGAAGRHRRTSSAVGTGRDRSSSSSSSVSRGGTRRGDAAGAGGEGGDDEDEEEEPEEEAVLLGTCGAGGSVVLGRDGRPLRSAADVDAGSAASPAFLKARRKVSPAARRAAWYGRDVVTDVALGTTGGEAGPADAPEGADEAPPAAAAPAPSAASLLGGTPAKRDRAQKDALVATIRAAETTALSRARELVAGGGVFPSLFAVAAYARAVARSRAAQLSASQSSVRALFSRFRGRASAQAGVLGEEAARATQAIATVQDAALSDTLDVVRTCVTLLGGFKLSEEGFTGRVNDVLGLAGDRPDGQDGPVAEDGAESRIAKPAEVVAIAERRAGARLTFLVDRQRALAAAWGRYRTRVADRSRGCAAAAAGLLLDGLARSNAAEADDVVSGIRRVLLLVPRTAAARPVVPGVDEDPAPAARRATVRLAERPWAGALPSEVAELVDVDEVALPSEFSREWVRVCARKAAEAGEAAAEEEEAILDARRAHRQRYAAPGEEDEEGEEAGAAAGGRLGKPSVTSAAVEAAAVAASAELDAGAVVDAVAADEALALAEARARDAVEAGEDEEAAAEARGAARDAARAAEAAWRTVGLTPAHVMRAAASARGSRVAHLAATAVRLQGWVRAWRLQRSTASSAMADVVADTISDFQRALDRELSLLSGRAKRAVARVERCKGDRWFLEALNGRLRAMNGEGLAEAVEASAAGSP